MCNTFSKTNITLMQIIAEEGLSDIYNNKNLRISNKYQLYSEIYNIANEFTKLTENVEIENQTIREKIHRLVSARLSLYKNINCNEKSFAGNLLSFMNNIQHLQFKYNFFYKIADDIWKSVAPIDSSYFSKRISLSYIYYSALRDISTTGLTEQILKNTQRQIENFGKVGKFKHDASKLIKFLLS